MEFIGNTIWITWHEHRRTRSLLSQLGNLPIFVFDDHRFFQRNFLGPIWTFSVLVKEKPDTVFIHFSYFLLFTINFYKYFFRWGNLTIISDCHNKALKRNFPSPFRTFSKIGKKILFAPVDLMIVTNYLLLPLAKTYCESVCILRDPLTDWGGEDDAIRSSRQESPSPYVFFVCSFDKDEPIDVIFCTALAIPEQLDLDVVISGDWKKSGVLGKNINQKRIYLPGFMSEQKYKETLFLAHVVVVLTNDPDCLVCGAYEALGASRPTVLSNTPTLKACFGNDVFYTSHSKEDILHTIGIASNPGNESNLGHKKFELAFFKEWRQFENILENDLGIVKLDQS